MAKVKELINKPDYKKMSNLVLGTEEELRRYKETELRNQKRSVGGSVSTESFQKYEDELMTLINQIKAGQKFYSEEVSKWDKTPEGDIPFPHTYTEYRRMIYSLQEQRYEVEEQQKRMLQEKEAAERRKKRPTPSPAPKKKSGWFKTMLLIGGAGLAGWWFGPKAVNSEKSQEGDKAPTKMEQRVSTPQDVLKDEYTKLQIAAVRAKREKIEQDAALKSTLRSHQLSAEQARLLAEQSSYERQAYNNNLGKARDQAHTANTISAANRQIRRNTYRW